jgi:hypothetical protein
MQRAADLAKKQADLLTFFVQTSANDMTSAARSRQAAEDQGVTPERRAAILTLLDSANTSLSEPFNWPMRRIASQRIAEARTEALRAIRDAVLAAVADARAQEEGEDSLQSVQAIIDEGVKLKRGPEGKIDPKEKIAWLRRGVAAWRSRLTNFSEPNPPSMVADLDAIDAAIASKDLDAVSFHMRRLFEQWATISTKRAKSLIAKATIPFCIRQRGELLVDLEAAQQTMRRLDGDPNLENWESELDRLRTKIDETPDTSENMRDDCMNVFFSLGESVYRLSNEVSSAMWNASVLPVATRHELAVDLSASLTPLALATLTRDARPLNIVVVTPKDELYDGREIAFRIGNLGPDWGPGTQIAIDFGDGQRTIKNAEEVKKNDLVTHSYANPKSFTVAVVAAEAFKADTTRPVDGALGEGAFTPLEIAPSPVSGARQIADLFFNVRFAFALVIASLLYYWRYYTTKSVFGANSFDYGQAFALGFVVSLAINDLPQKLAQFIPFKG